MTTKLLQLFMLSLIVAACGPAPVIDDAMKRIDGALPANFSGAWERDYARDDDVNAALQVAYSRLARTSPDQQFTRGASGPTISPRDIDSLHALARLAELITRPDALIISQTEHEISVARKDDFAILCSFYDGVAKATTSPYGAEICGWDGNNLVSNLVLPDGLQVTHRLTVAENSRQLRIITTVSSPTSRVPFTLRRFYRKYNRPTSEFNCIETLSMKRVCSTGELTP